LWGVGPFGTTLHVRKLVAQRADAAAGKPFRDRAHEGMIHSSAGTMRQDVTRPCVARVLQQARDGHTIAYLDGDVFDNGHGPKHLMRVVICCDFIA
jgi:hypothetical protein